MMENIYQQFKETAKRRGKATAVIYVGTRYSYQKIWDMAERFAYSLKELGFKEGERLLFYIPNGIQWVIAWLGTLKADGICVPITPIYTPYDLRYIANDSHCETILCADTNFGYVKRIQDETPIKRIIVSRMADLLPWWKRIFAYLFDIVPKGKISFDESTFSIRRLIKDGKIQEQSNPRRKGDDIAEILYTGGTTKFPKGVPISHSLFLRSAIEQIKISEPLFPCEENVIMGNAPLFHILGQTCSLSTLLVGGSIILQPKVNLDATFESISRFKAKTMIGVPTLYRMILEHDRIDQYDLSSVKYWFCAGDVLPVEVAKRWEKRFGRRIYQGYGATETCGGVSMCPVDQESPYQSVGKVLPSKRVMIVDPSTLEPVPEGESGELLVSSDPMVEEYLNKPEETEKSFIKKDGRLWYRTGDILKMDRDGNLYFVDRTVDTIKHKGYRVSASEIEAVLQEHPAVVGSCVVGVPDERVGQRIKAFVVLKEDIKGITGYDLIRWCRERLAPYKVPHYIEFRDMLPKSKVGKLLRREIRDEELRRKT